MAMVMSGSTITITLGTPSGAVRTAAGNGTMTWTPTTSPYDRAGNACLATRAASPTPSSELRARPHPRPDGRRRDRLPVGLGAL